MRAWAAACLLLLAAAGGRAQVFQLSNGGRLELFPVGAWRIEGEDQGEFRIYFFPGDERINAAGTLSVASEGSDDFPTQEKLAQQVGRATERLIEKGGYVERRPVVKPFYTAQGFGYYALLTDRKLVGLPPVRGDFKLVCLGLIRLAPAVIVKVQLLSDGEQTEGHQQLLGMVEGMAYTPP
jgi:hypothetical protein